MESPTKVRTLKKYLGKEYNVAATVGHIKDLPKKEMGIDIENGFKPNYITISGKKKVISELKKAAGDAKDIYLAPDPDREGEAIAWHAAEVLKKNGRHFYRVLFHELTEKAIKAAMNSPEALDPNRYEAQQARRILDRIVGYEISPLLWKKVKQGLSAGRVQSVAVRIICEREREIQAFVPEEYWSVTAHLKAEDPPPFTAYLARKNNRKISIPNEDTVKEILKEISGISPVVDTVKKRTTKRNPLPPFITSTLQQDAIRKLRFSAKKTMVVAQQLYEGIELGQGGPVGLITYMRTDSTRIADEAAKEAIFLIRETKGDDYAIKDVRVFKTKKKVQDAHECIRPTSVRHTPDSVASSLTQDQLKLYTLIWKRFMACQSAPARIDTQNIIIQVGNYQFNASGSRVRFPGFMAFYSTETELKDKEIMLPPLTEGQELDLEKYEPKQHFTQPPPRFSEASLVKELEENGIGRPSTYATILSTIREKGYVEMLKSNFRPTELGFIVNDLIVKSFPDILDVAFTANLEDELDRVEAAETDYVNVLSRFYTPFQEKLENAAETMQSMKGEGIPTGLDCPVCGKKLHIKVGRNGHFLACTGYPECTYSTDYERDEKGNIVAIKEELPETTDKICPKCGKPMLVKRGRYGSFYACSGYPECRHTESLQPGFSPLDTGVSCPREGCDGNIMERRSRRGKVFFGCSRYPDCDYAIWNKPVNTPCPACGHPFLTEKTTKKDGSFLVCPIRECGFRKFPDED